MSDTSSSIRSESVGHSTGRGRSSIGLLLNELLMLLKHNLRANTVVTREIKLIQNYISLRRRPSEMILFQRVELTCQKLFQNYFTGYSTAAREHFPTCSMSPKQF